MKVVKTECVGSNYVEANVGRENGSEKYQNTFCIISFPNQTVKTNFVRTNVPRTNAVRAKFVRVNVIRTNVVRANVDRTKLF